MEISRISPLFCARDEKRWFGLDVNSAVSGRFIEKVRRSQQECKQAHGGEECPENCGLKQFLDAYASGGAERC